MSKTIVVDTFFEIHNEEHTHIKHPESCPICDILVRETFQVFEDNVSKKVLDTVIRHMAVWETRGSRIAQNTTPSVLTSKIMDSVLLEKISPKQIDLVLEPYEIYNHPYVIQKIKELTK